jgi:hypothetical protein
MPPGVPRNTGQVLAEVTPKDIYSRLKKLKKDCTRPGWRNYIDGAEHGSITLTSCKGI